MQLTRHSPKHDILKKVPLFINLDRKHLEEIAAISDEVQAKAGSVLAQEGEFGREFVFILGGEARVEQNGKIINRLYPFDFFGEISLIDSKPRVASVIADTDVDTLVIHYRFFQPLLDSVPGLSTKIAIALCTYLRDTEGKSRQHT